MQKKYDYLIIGSGPAGHVSAIKAAQLGLQVAVVEKDEEMFGGVCLNEGCIPAKSLFKSAEIYDQVRKSPELCGLDVKCGPVNMPAFVKKSRDAAGQLKKGLSFLFKKNGIDLIRGTARFLDKHSVEIVSKEGETSKVEAKNFLIATGSTPRALPGMSFDGKRILTSSDCIRLEKVPGKILVIGGGAIGLELASFFNIVGSEAAIVEVEDRLLPLEDKEVGRKMQSIFKQRGILVHTSSSAKEVSAGKNSVKVLIQDKDQELPWECDIVLVSVGRAPSTSELKLDKADIKTDEKGFIRVDHSMRTNVKNIFAAGDVVSTPMLAHVAYAEGEIAADAAAGQDPEPIDYTCVPNAVYTDVQAASVGITEEKAREDNLDFSTGKVFFKSSGKAVINSRTEGFIKILADNETHKLLGVHILGDEASDLIHEFVVAKKAGLTVEEIGRTVHAHPTLSETAVDACKAVFGRPIHG